MSDSAGGTRVGGGRVAISLSAMLLEEFEPESRACRRTLERVPDDRLGWRPHPKSAAMGWLAGHLANVPSWASMTIRTESLDIAPDGEESGPLPEPESVAEVVQAFDRNAEDARVAIRGASNDELLVEPAPEWADPAHSDAPLGAPELRLQPSGPPPRAARRVPAAERHIRPGDLRAVRGRESVRVVTPRWCAPAPHTAGRFRRDRRRSPLRPAGAGRVGPRVSLIGAGPGVVPAPAQRTGRRVRVRWGAT